MRFANGFWFCPLATQVFLTYKTPRLRGCVQRIGIKFALVSITSANHFVIYGETIIHHLTRLFQ